MGYLVLHNCPTRFIDRSKGRKFSHFLVFAGIAVINFLVVLLGLPFLITLLMARRFRTASRS